jgi:hypothetical protein
MALPMILAGTQAAIGLGQAISGWAQKKKLTRPEYQIPEEIEQNMTEAELMSYYGMPDAQKAEYMQNIQRSTQAALRGISDRKGGLGAVAAAQQTQQDAYMNLLSADVQQRMQNIQTAQQMRQTMASYRDKAFEINEMQPYQQSYAEAQSLIGAGMQNVMGGLTSMAQTQMLKESMAVDAVTGGGFAETAVGGFLKNQASNVGNFVSNQYQGFQNRRAIANTDLGQMQPLNLGFQTPNPFMSPAPAPDNYVMNY